MPRAKVVEVARRQAPTYLAKSQQFLEQARVSAAGGAHDAAMLGAVHAAISAADAVCVAIAGLRSADSEHQRATDLLQEVVGPSAKSHIGQFRMLVAKKNIVEYEARRVSAREADEAVKRAERFVAWAEKTLEKARIE